MAKRNSIADVGLAVLIALFVVSGCASTGGAGAGAVESTAFATQSTVRDITDLSDVLPEVQGDARRTLVVFDIDDTLLTSISFYGSDYWYEWQKTLSKNDAGWVPCRFDVISLNYEVGIQQPTQENAPQIFKSVTQDKMLLTSRSAMSRGATLRELKRAGYELPATLGTNPDGIIYSWQKDAASKPQIVSYHEGVFMVTGQNKGMLLVDLLKRLDKTYERVVLVDDGQTNIDVMQAALKTENIAYTGLRYIRIKKPLPLPADQREKADEAAAAWDAIRAYLGAVSPARLRDFEAERCYY